MFGQTQFALGPWTLCIVALMLMLLSFGGWYVGLLMGTKLLKVTKSWRGLIVLLLDIVLLGGAFLVQELVLVNNWCALTSIAFSGLLGAHIGVALAEWKVLNKLEASESTGFRFSIFAVTTLLVFAIVQLELVNAQHPSFTQQMCAVASGANVLMLLLTGIFVAMISSSERKLNVVRKTG
ncbi:MAG: hypothetical protein K2X93_00745 [Candidatus Obscuribacterales bacterium]|nr:hypothetical protein [Candidatus Obscuribacterales bacterium]